MEPVALAETDIGKVKPRNEDSFLIDKRMKLYVVADGMGGHAAGDVASATAVREIRRYMKENEATIQAFVEHGSGRDRVLDLIEQAVRLAGRAIYHIAQENPEKRGMGTTVSLLLLTPNRGFIAHVGDSRVYLVRGGEVFQLTEDHSLINELIKRGKLRPEDAETAPYQNAVTRAVGVYEDVEVDVLDFEIADGDNFMLCSDGLSGYLRDATEIMEVMNQAEFASAPRKFIELANDRGGKDNITSLLVRVEDGAEQEASEVAVKMDVLRQMPLFQHLSYVELVEILNVSEIRAYAGGDLIFDEGDKGDAMYVVLEGRVGIEKNGVELARLGPGGHFGEMAILDKAPRSAAARASLESRAIRISRRKLFLLMRRDKEVAVKLLWCFLQVLNNRLRSTSEDLTSARHENLELHEMLGFEELDDVTPVDEDGIEEAE
jgi:serine/threonine protein phosphatase PrpC